MLGAPSAASRVAAVRRAAEVRPALPLMNMSSKLAPAPGRMIARLVLLPDAPGPTGGARLHASEWRWAVGRSRLAREFPTVSIAVTDEPTALQAHVRVRDWRGLGFDPTPFDEALRTQRPTTLYLQGARDGEAAATALEVLTRYQGLVVRRNRASSTPVFTAVLAQLRELHDLSKPLVAADYWHALDAWQWTLRLWPDAPATVQVAALFHDVERLVSKADVRVEHYAPDYHAFKLAHARAGAAMLPHVLRPAGVRGEELAQVRILVEGHEQGHGLTREQVVLAEADALSFFTVNSAGYLDYFGPEQMHRKVAYTLRRMRRESIARLATIRHRADVERILVAELRELSGAAAREAARDARNDDRELPVEIEPDEVISVEALQRDLAAAAGGTASRPRAVEEPVRRRDSVGPPPLPSAARRARNEDVEQPAGSWRDLGHRGVGALASEDLDTALEHLGVPAGVKPPADALAASAPPPPPEPTPPVSTPAPAESTPSRPGTPDPGSPEFWQRRVPLPAPASAWPPPAASGALEPPAAPDGDDDEGDDDDWPTSLHRAERRRPARKPL